jgi:hypothetical protein
MFLRYFLILATALNVANLSSFAAPVGRAGGLFARTITIKKADLLAAFRPADLKKTTLSCDQNQKITAQVSDTDQAGQTVELWMVGLNDSITAEKIINNLPDEILCKVVMGTCKQHFNYDRNTLWLNSQP